MWKVQRKREKSILAILNNRNFNSKSKKVVFFRCAEQSCCFVFKHAFERSKPVKDANNTYLLKGTYIKNVR